MEQTQSELDLATGELKNCFDGFIDLPNCLEAASNQVEETIRRLTDRPKIWKGDNVDPGMIAPNCSEHSSARVLHYLRN